MTHGERMRIVQEQRLEVLDQRCDAAFAGGESSHAGLVLSNGCAACPGRLLTRGAHHYRVLAVAARKRIGAVGAECGVAEIGKMFWRRHQRFSVRHVEQDFIVAHGRWQLFSADVSAADQVAAVEAEMQSDQRGMRDVMETSRPAWLPAGSVEQMQVFVSRGDGEAFAV